MLSMKIIEIDVYKRQGFGTAFCAQALGVRAQAPVRGRFARNPHCMTDGKIEVDIFGELYYYCNY